MYIYLYLFTVFCYRYECNPSRPPHAHTRLSHAGKVQTTESTYKHKMQVQEGMPADTSSSTIESSPPDQLLAAPNETSTPDKAEGPTNEAPPTPPIEEQQPGDEVAEQQTTTTN